ncbi:MAG: hypothetical protein HRF45_02450 [Fimbriimonadia bacterium]|jgi:divalent metal cation (Fe/Co/Zn/Cd) transporter
MGNILKFIVIGILALLAIQVMWWLFKAALALVIPVAVLAALGFIIYHLMGGRLSDRSDKSLPK